MEGLEVRQGRAAHERRARADLYADPGEPLDPGENDLTRGARQQQVIQAVSSKLAGVGTFLDLPFIGGDLLKPLATDLSTGDFVPARLGAVPLLGSAALQARRRSDVCRRQLGAAIASEDNRAVISMFTGASAPQPPPPGSSAYQPGCELGNHPFPH